MAYSSEDYYIKPVIPRMLLGLKIMGIQIIKIDIKLSLIDYNLFADSLSFYYKKDKKFHKKLDEYLFLLDRSDNDYYLISKIETRIKNDRIKNKVHNLIGDVHFSLDGSDYFEKNHGQYWIKQTFKQRKRIIKKLYPKKEYFDMYHLLESCNIFLKFLAEKSLSKDKSLALYIEVGKYLDWFFLSVTECEYQKTKEFRELFQANIRLKNDVVQLSSALNILMQDKSIEILISGESDSPSIESYIELFKQILSSANEIVSLYEKMELEENNRQSNIEFEKKKKELLSMHDLTFNRKIHEMDKIENKK